MEDARGFQYYASKQLQLITPPPQRPIGSCIDLREVYRPEPENPQEKASLCHLPYA